MLSGVKEEKEKKENKADVLWTPRGDNFTAPLPPCADVLKPVCYVVSEPAVGSRGVTQRRHALLSG